MMEQSHSKWLEMMEKANPRVAQAGQVGLAGITTEII